MVDSTFRDRFEQMLSILGWDRPTFCVKAGVSQQVVHGWLKRGRVGTDSEPAVRQATGVSMDWLQAGVGQPFPNTKVVNMAGTGSVEANVVKVPAFTIRGVDGRDGLDPEMDVMIPVTDIEVSAGSPDGPPIPEFLPTRYELPYQLAWLHANGARPKDILIMPVRGRSMEPVLWHGDKVVLHRGRTRVQDGAVYALVQPEGARVKRLYNMPDGGVRIISDNPDKQRFPDETVTPDAMFRLLIIGQAIDRMGSGGLSL
jgi:phage repressor protein C with HTH and peptisase S24 domain